MKFKKQLLILTFYLLILNLCISVTGCNNCDSQCTEGNTESRISNVVKKYFYFNVGTWWVYENELSFERDSIFVIGNKIENRMEDESCDCNELLWVSLASSLKDSIFFNTESYGSPSITFMKVYQGISRYDLTYRFAVQTDTSLKLENQHNGIIEFIPDYKGPKGDYKNVYRCFYHKALTDYYSDSYFAPNIGLIRYCEKEGDGTYWNLIKHNIVQ